MYNVSEQYKIDINKLVRNPSYIKVRFGIVDPQAKDDASIVGTSNAPYSDASNIKIENVVAFRYDTLEHNTFFLDNSKHKLADDVYTEFQGYVSGSFSNVNCEFQSPPSLIVTYPTAYEYAGLTFNFDEVRSEFSSEVLLEYYLSNVKIGEYTILPNRWDYVMKTPVPLHDELRITFKKTNLPYKRAKLSYIAFGIIETYEDDRVVEAEQHRKVDVLSTVLPIGDFKFTFLDILNEYNPENPSGLYQYMEQRQPVTFEYGYQLDSGDIEWVLGGINYSTGKVLFDSNGRIPKVTITTNNTIQYLDSVYREGLYYPMGRTLYELAQDLLDKESVLYTLDPVLNDYITYAPLPIDTVKNNLQLIANASMSTLDVDRDGKITISRSFESNGQTDFKFTKENSYNIPTVNKLPPLRNLVTANYTYTVKTTSEEIAKIDISGANNTEYFLEYNLATDVSISVTGLTVVGSPQYFARGCYITLTGNGTVTITGKLIDVAEVNYVKNFNLNGVDCTITNELITDSTWTKTYADWVGGVLLLNNEYSIENRGYPELDPVDKVTVDTFYTLDLNTFLTENRISYNGALKGFTKLIIAQ